MRYKKYISIDIKDLSEMMTAWYCFKADPAHLGEAVANMTYDDLCKKLRSQCKVELTHEQLYNLCWYYKYAVLELVKPPYSKLRISSEYNSMFKRLQKKVPELFKVDKDGELLLKENKEIFRDG